MRLSVKYQLETLDEIVGQPAIVRRLKALAANPYPCCLLFEGPGGVGKSAAAKALVRDLGVDPFSGVVEYSAANLTIEEVRKLFDSTFRYRPMMGNPWHILLVTAFRALVAQGQVSWRPLWEKTDDEGEVIDHFATSDQPATSAEGYRLVWYHSLRKAKLDAVARSGRIERALKQLAALREKLRSPRTRYRKEAKVTETVAEILQSCGAASWIVVEVEPQTEETFHQDHRGRPGKDTRYVKKVATRFDLLYRIDDARVAADATSDGIFPLITNVTEFLRTGTASDLQAAAGDREAILSVEDRL